VRGVAYQWRQEGKSWKLPLLARIAEGAFSAKPSTPYGTGTLHDFMHAKVTIVDDSIFVGSFNLSRSGERNAENVLEFEDPKLAGELTAFADGIRGRYPRLELGS
jgi:phosphatidylserine/phosphatidylglycerophosphate/cardiolipin synthase-like enzyme